MSFYSVTEEIVPRRTHFLVELRGFEPMAIADTVISHCARLRQKVGAPSVMDLMRVALDANLG
jgi:hypothetical protein